MRDNPNNDTLGNLVGKEAGDDSDPETPPQSDVARDPDQTNIKEAIDDKRVGDVEGENDDQLDSEDDEERTSNVQTKQG